MYTTRKVSPGLQIELVGARTTWRARAHVKGEVGYYNTGVTDPVGAETQARAWFEEWRTEGRRGSKTMARAATLHAANYRPREHAARVDFLKRWNAIRGVAKLGDMLPSEVTSKYLRSFAIARGPIAGSTAKKDWDTIRPILRTAMEEGWIDTLPAFPKVFINRNPRLPFTREEYKTLHALATEEMRDYMDLVVLGLMRPYEVLRLTTQDIADHPVTDRMSLRMRRKTGITYAPVPLRFPTLRAAVRRRVKAAKGGRLFPYNTAWFPAKFRPLLEATGLDKAPGHTSPRDSWSLRATGICLEIKRQRRKRGAADYLKIARWAGTSMSRIDGHYAAFLP